MAQTAAAELDLVDIDRKRPNRFLSFGLRLMREKPLGFVVDRTLEWLRPLLVAGAARDRARTTGPAHGHLGTHGRR